MSGKIETLFSRSYLLIRLNSGQEQNAEHLKEQTSLKDTLIQPNATRWGYITVKAPRPKRAG